LSKPPLFVPNLPVKPLLIRPVLCVVEFEARPIAALGFLEALIPALNFSESSISVGHAEKNFSIPMLSAFA
jgi:hypothetical protein